MVRICSLVLLAALILSAQTTTQLITDLTSPDPNIRSQAFYALQMSGQANIEPAKTAIIGLLATETTYSNSLASNSSTTVSDDYATYYGDVVLLVASFQDSRAINNLVSIIERGNLAISGLASFGNAALDPVILKFSASDTLQQLAAAITVVKMLSPANISKVSDIVSQRKIRAALTRASGSQNAFLQKAASQGFSLISASPVLGDVNGDGKVDCSDVTIVRLALGTKNGQMTFNPEADLNLDGVVDIRDMAFVSQKLSTGTRCQ